MCCLVAVMSLRDMDRLVTTEDMATLLGMADEGLGREWLCQAWWSDDVRLTVHPLRTKCWRASAGKRHESGDAIEGVGASAKTHGACKKWLAPWVPAFFIP